MRTLLITGFDIWPGVSNNSSWIAVSNSQPAGNFHVKKIQLPVSWARAVPTLMDHLDDDVAAVVAFGMARNTAWVQVEQIAINLTDLQADDADGRRPANGFVVPQGPPAYWSGLPAHRLVETLNLSGIPARLSPFAGTFLCNFVFYSMMDWLNKLDRNISGGFVHLPPLPNSGELSESQLTRAVELICEETARDGKKI